MQIKTHTDKDFREPQVSRRLDAAWADTLKQAIEEAFCEGAHSLLLNLSQVVYMSSAGLGMLVRAQTLLAKFEEVRRLNKSLAERLPGFMCECLHSQHEAVVVLQPWKSNFCGDRMIRSDDD